MDNHCWIRSWLGRGLVQTRLATLQIPLKASSALLCWVVRFLPNAPAPPAKASLLPTKQLIVKRMAKSTRIAVVFILHGKPLGYIYFTNLAIPAVWPVVCHSPCIYTLYAHKVHPPWNSNKPRPFHSLIVINKQPSVALYKIKFSLLLILQLFI